MNYVYAAPGKFGLECLSEIQWSPTDYEYDVTAVWRDVTTGELFWADDGGCSCTSPFEKYRDRVSLQAGTAEMLQAHLEERLSRGAERNEWNDPWAAVADVMFRAIR